MVKKNQIAFLQFRDEVLDPSGLENQYGVKLPPIYRSFISSFKPYFAHHKIRRGTGAFQSFLIECFPGEAKEEYTIDDDELAFESFKDMEEVFSNEPSNKGYLSGYLVIAYHGFGGGLLVGIDEENADKIYFNSDSTHITFIANNIFELIQRFQLVQYNFDGSEVDVNKLYRNWGEDFWRIQE